MFYYTTNAMTFICGFREENEDGEQKQKITNFKAISLDMINEEKVPCKRLKVDFDPGKCYYQFVILFPTYLTKSSAIVWLLIPYTWLLAGAEVVNVLKLSIPSFFKFYFLFTDNIQYTHKPLPRTKKPYKPTNENRNIKNYWFREFPWLVYDETRNLFFCSYCTAVKCDNIFTRGRPAVKPRKDYMVKHEATNPHKTAMSRLKIIPDVLQER